VGTASYNGRPNETKPNARSYFLSWWTGNEDISSVIILIRAIIKIATLNIFDFCQFYVT
jgi:hypothetical protein